MIKEIVLASNNAGKIKEIKGIFAGLGINVLSMSEAGIDIDIVEDADTFIGNATKKAETIFEMIQTPVLADDSGLCVDYLDGRPGVFSHRYAGDSDENGIIKLLGELEGVPDESRRAHYHCTMVFIAPNIKVSFDGICNGYIAVEPKGKNGFAYDPIFYIPEKGKTMAELSDYEKNQYSHRGRAVRKVYSFIKGLVRQ